MDELYSIMRDFLEVEYNQESLLCLLKRAEAACAEEGEQAEARLIANSAKYYLQALQEELKSVIGRLDAYIVEN